MSVTVRITLTIAGDAAERVDGDAALLAPAGVIASWYI